MENSDKKFWVIFDTCTRPQYLMDLYNLLAMPNGSIIRYDYREKWISKNAIELATDFSTAGGPTNILLMYAQKRDFLRGNLDPKGAFSYSQIIWIPTRIAEMKLIPPREGEAISFDLLLKGYPKNEQNIVRNIIEPLHKTNEVPYNIWVTISDKMEEFNILQKGESTENWQSIINGLSSSPSQFAGEIFWRLKNPTNAAGNEITYSYDEKFSSGVITGVEHYPKFYQGQLTKFEIMSHIPSIDTEIIKHTASKISLSLDVKDKVYFRGPDVLDLRASGNQLFEFRIKKFEKLTEDFGLLEFSSSVQDKKTEVVGAEFFLKFSISSSLYTKLLSFICFIVISTAFVVASVIIDNNIIIGTLLYLFAFIGMLFLSYILRGKLPWDWK